MWAVNIINEQLREEFKIVNKLYEKIGEKNKVEVFESDRFGKIALLNEERIFLESEIAIDSEMLVHVPMCSNPNIKSALVISYNKQIAKELKKHEGVNVDFLIEDSSAFEAMDYFNRESRDITNLTYIHRLDLEKQYDLIIYDSIVDIKKMEKLHAILGDEGIMICRTAPLILADDAEREEIATLAKAFYIFIPYVAPYSVALDKSYLFASKRWHPQSDILLQKSDFVPDCRYYTAEVHMASFSQPKIIKERFKGIFKN